MILWSFQRKSRVQWHLNLKKETLQKLLKLKRLKRNKLKLRSQKSLRLPLKVKLRRKNQRRIRRKMRKSKPNLKKSLFKHLPSQLYQVSRKMTLTLKLWQVLDRKWLRKLKSKEIDKIPWMTSQATQRVTTNNTWKIKDSRRKYLQTILFRLSLFNKRLSLNKSPIKDRQISSQLKNNPKLRLRNLFWRKRTKRKRRVVPNKNQKIRLDRLRNQQKKPSHRELRNNRLTRLKRRPQLKLNRQHQLRQKLQLKKLREKNLSHR